MHAESDWTQRPDGHDACLTAALENLGEGVLITDAELSWPGPQITYANAAMSRMSGYTRQELIGQTPRILQGEHSQRDKLDTVRRTLEIGQTVRCELTSYRKDGTPFEALLTISPVTGSDGEVVAYVSVHFDLTERKQTERTLTDREQRLDAILNTATDAIITIDRKGVIEAVNPSTERMFGFAREELIGQNIRMLMPAPYGDQHDDHIARYCRTGERRIIGTGREVTAKRKDGSTFPIDLTVSEIDHMKKFTGVIRDISIRRQLERRVLDIAAAEQRRIGQDLHDDLGGELSGLGILADTLATTLSRAGRPASEVSQARQIVDGLKHAVSQVRILSFGLIPVEVRSDGLMAALQQLADQVCDRADLNCVFNCPSAVPCNDAATATQLFRIAQEAVTNSVRHASPEMIRINLTETSDQIVLSINDDGCGFDTSLFGSVPGTSELQLSGIGLHSMRYRAQQIGATLSIESQSDSGTTITCTLPLHSIQPQQESEMRC